ncbi:MAG: peptidyl-prolyl cis-trans isomerase [Candidatus Edwardsbacteria bacterium]|nr:peptidyl-prolyl cis-trans isomerase [Candidatus Edwardsbacteria bacterium]MBU1576797.1 peptidyl-prolyl cis-trans isomerase [Candidatus Edwardsbacteria bacterium]MBU2463888.1 peptidyl-prolyl cis-trans isomerase [Candidatus Edwardsbacteria bacterium]MBU2593346.1 peptidyl-prolyl cis-trans isomerase [Candidatus Edwardsbacteria bacterium]
MKRWLSPALILSLIIALTSCSSRDKTIANVGNSKVTLGDFQDAYKPPMIPGDSAAVLAGKQELLNRMVEQKLLVNEAVSRGMDKDPKLAQDLEELKKNILLQELYKDEILKHAQPSDSDVKKFYARLGKEAKARHILVKTEEEAKEIAKALKGGGDFAQLAGSKSVDRGSAERGGDLGWFGWGKMVDEFQSAIFSMKPGQTSKPIKTAFGFHIIRLDSLRDAPLQPFEEMKDRIKQQLSSTRPRELANKYITKLREGANIKIKDDIIQALAAKQAPGQPMPALPQVSPEELKKTVITYNGGSWTVQNLYDNVNRYMRGTLDLNQADRLKEQLEGLIVSDLLLARAKSKGIEQNPKVKAQLSRTRDNMLAESFYREDVSGKVMLTPDQAKKYYQDNKKEFYQPAKALVHIIAVPEKDQAQEIYGLLSKGADFSQLARERSVDPSKASGGALRWVESNDAELPELSRLVFGMALNQPSRPFAYRNNFAIIKVTEKTPAKQRTFEESQREIEFKLRQSQEETILGDLLASLKTKYPVKIDQALLAKAEASTAIEEK